MDGIPELTNQKSSSTHSEWEEIDDTFENEPVFSLFDVGQKFESVNELVVDHRKRFMFDLSEIINSLQLDLYKSIQLINYVRKMVEEERLKNENFDQKEVAKEICVEIEESRGVCFQCDEYFIPTLEDDSLLYQIEQIIDYSDQQPLQTSLSSSTLSNEEEEEEEEEEEGFHLSTQLEVISSHVTVEGRGRDEDGLEDEEGRLRRRVRELEGQLSTCVSLMQGILQSDDDLPISSSSSISQQQFTNQPSSSQFINVDGKEEEEEMVVDGGYFSAYSHTSIHETMLKDTVRMNTYSQALSHPSLTNKVIVDVGSGTGILCLLAVRRGGCKKAIGIEKSDMIKKAELISHLNSHLIHPTSTTTISFIQGRAEDDHVIDKLFLLLDEDEKDEKEEKEIGDGRRDGKDDEGGDDVVIVSEWMGYGLLFESMLPSGNSFLIIIFISIF